jgi:Domain of unknown function (DUF4389)
MVTPQAPYPVQLSVDYPDRPLNRLTSAFRIFVAIPAVILLGSVSGGTLLTVPSYTGPAGSKGSMFVLSGAGGPLFLGPLLMILFRKKYPRWWFDWNLELQRFTNRVLVYILLMDDRYPATDQEQSVHVDFVYPDAASELNRWLPLVKWLLAIPHFLVLIFLWIAVLVVTFIAWVAILFTGRYPRAIFDFVEGVVRWEQRVIAYSLLLVTDRYPPFRLAL